MEVPEMRARPNASAAQQIMLVAVLILLLITTGCLYQLLGTARDKRRFPPPGRLIDIGPTRLHISESGKGHPPVILEAGIGASSLNWTTIQSALSQFTRVCSYDRAGLGWSDPAASPRTIANAVEELHALVTAAQIPTPLVLVGHSFGGLLARCYAARYPDQIAGLVLLDPLAVTEWRDPSPSQQKLLKRGAMLSRRGAFLARLGIVRFGLAMLSGGLRLIPKLVARAASRGTGESAISRLVREVQKMPPETWPIVQAHWCQPKSFITLANYLEFLPASAAEATECGDLPITILSASNSTAVQQAERDALATHSRKGKHLIAANSGHWIHFDEPKLVIASIRELL
jgi:pimeloyl-ACP methyl ester carboxylesterase